MLPPKRSTRAIARRASAPLPRLRRLPRVNEIVEIRWEDRDKYFRGTLARSIKKKPHSFFVRYDDGDCYNVNLNEFQWRYANQETAVTQEKEDYNGEFEFMPGDLEELSEQDGKVFARKIEHSPVKTDALGRHRENRGSVPVVQVEPHTCGLRPLRKNGGGNQMASEKDHLPFCSDRTSINDKYAFAHFTQKPETSHDPMQVGNASEKSWKKRMLREFLALG